MFAFSRMLPTLLSLGIATMPCLAETTHSPFAVADESPIHVTKAGDCEVRCIDAHACGEEGQKVIGILEKLIAAYSQGDLKAYQEYLDDNCSMFDENTHKILSGKQQVLEHLKESFAGNMPSGKHPLVSFSIDQPFAKVTNDTCVVTFFATKEIGGAHPHKERAHVTDVFVKRGEQWKKLHWSGKWESIEG